MADTTYAQAEAYWIAAGGDPSVAPQMAAIAEAESSLDSTIIQAGQPYATTGYGLWQITPGDSEPQCGTDSGLLNGSANACAAVAKYKSQGITAWTTYTSGAYEQYMNSSTTPDSNGTTAATTPGTAAAAPAATQQDTNCLIGGQTIDLVVASLSLPCFFEKSWLRAVLGGALMAGGALVGVFAVAILTKTSVKSVVNRATPGGAPVHGSPALQNTPAAATAPLSLPTAAPKEAPALSGKTYSAGELLGSAVTPPKAVSKGTGNAPISVNSDKVLSAPDPLAGFLNWGKKNPSQLGAGGRKAMAKSLSLGEALEALPELIAA